ncbi:MAG: choice-of-anchor Q domain-containing protein, partial [Phycisphaerales bacterium JB065]
HRMNGESGWTFRDLIAEQTRLLVLEHNQGLDQSRIVSIDRETGNRTIIIEDGQDFIDPTSIAIVVEQAEQSSFIGFADSTTSGSLRAEIIEANASSSPTEIYLNAGTYTLSIAGTNEDNAMTGDLDIRADIRIKGQGAGATIIDAAQIDRVFDVHPGASLLLEDLSVRNGFAAGSIPRGGNIRANGTLVLIDCEIFGGETPSGWGGGGVSAYDNFYAVRTSFRANTSGSAGGGFTLYDEANATIDRCRINSNTAAGTNGGGAAIRQLSSASIINTSIFFNSANWSGGALAIDTKLAVDIRYCTITRNDSNDSGSITGASGGGILFSSSTNLTLASTVVADNLDSGSPNDVAGLSPTAELNLDGYCFFGTPVDGNYIVTGDTTGTTFGGNAQLQPMFGGVFSIIGYQPTATSPLVDNADPQVYPATDQLGQPRPVNIGGGFFAIPDIGAIERQLLPCPADVTGDRNIDLADLNLVLANFGQTTPEGDTNDDGQVDLADLNAVLAAFGQACP